MRSVPAKLAAAAAGLALALLAGGPVRAAAVGAPRPAGGDLALMGALAAVSLSIRFGLRRFGKRSAEDEAGAGPAKAAARAETPVGGDAH